MTLLTVGLLSACASGLPPAQTLTGPQGQSVTWLMREATPPRAPGTPVVVLQSGLGDDHTPWAAVIRRLTPRQAVFSYDRPGYGRSDAVMTNRSPCSVAAELHALLQQAGVAPPYLLVGHSLGGLYQHAFARLYPQEVAGLLLLDPTHPQHFAALQAEAPGAAQTLRTLRTLTFSATAQREFDDQALCQERLLGTPPQPVPARLLVSTERSALDSPAFIRVLERLRLDWQALTGAPTPEPVPGAGHYLQTDAPQAVATAIEAMASASTATASTPSAHNDLPPPTAPPPSRPSPP